MVRKILKKSPILYNIVRKIHIIVSSVLNFPKRLGLSLKYKKEISRIQSTKTKKIWFLCVPIHNNLGDYAQYNCIKKWIQEKYPTRMVIEVPTIPIRYDFCGILKLLKKKINKGDLIIFQSGYTSSDLHPDEIVHRKIVNNFKDNVIVFFPQTVKYSCETEAKKTAHIYNNHNYLFFLVRDEVSYEIAKKYFYKTKILLMPDIVTSLIGTKQYDCERKGIIFCIRNDSEKKYRDNLIKEKFKNLISDCDEWTDTTLEKNEKCSSVVLDNKIQQFACHKLTITDRFHGTILSLVASTPVIVLKTTDHKVIGGAQWFKNVYPDYIKIADNIEEAVKMAEAIQRNVYKTIDYPYFKKEYYDCLDEFILQMEKKLQ